MADDKKTVNTLIKGINSSISGQLGDFYINRNGVIYLLSEKQCEKRKKR